MKLMYITYKNRNTREKLANVLTNDYVYLCAEYIEESVFVSNLEEVSNEINKVIGRGEQITNVRFSDELYRGFA